MVTVMLIYGGRGLEREVSILGAQHLLPRIRGDFRPLPVLIDKDGRWLNEGKELLLCRGGVLKDGEFIKTDCAIPLLHGDYGEDGRVQGALDCASIPYVGCDGVVGAICRNKYIVKAVADRLSVPTLPCLLAVRGEDTDGIANECERKIGYPLFLKPTSLGSSVGASQVRSREELKEALSLAFTLTDRVIVEPLLADKRELECGYLRIKGKDLFTKCGEILCEGFYDYQKKYAADGADTSVVAKLTRAAQDKIRDYSAALVRGLGVRDIARIDYFLSGDKIYFNEINTMPGMTESSLYPKMIEASGVSLDQMTEGLIRGALYGR